MFILLFVLSHVTRVYLSALVSFPNRITREKRKSHISIRRVTREERRTQRDVQPFLCNVLLISYLFHLFSFPIHKWITQERRRWHCEDSEDLSFFSLDDRMSHESRRKESRHNAIIFPTEKRKELGWQPFLSHINVLFDEPLVKCLFPFKMSVFSFSFCLLGETRRGHRVCF